MWSLQTRIHSLNAFPENCFVKRDDELSCGISGSKLRKYASLIPKLNKLVARHLIVIAGPQSNNLLAAVQLARELQMSLKVFLIKPWNDNINGNYRFTRLFLREDDIHWVDRSDWQNVEEIANQYQQEMDVSSYLLPEGAACWDAMPGAMSLGEDIIRNEKENNINFQHIFIDSGTGFSAAGLIKYLSEKKHPAKIHVLLLADREQDFYQKLAHWTDYDSSKVICFYPSNAKSFGSVNQTVKKEIKRVAIEEGFLLDPIYSAKLFHEARKKMESETFPGNKLIIHSGGILSLSGFEL